MTKFLNIKVANLPCQSRRTFTVNILIPALRRIAILTMCLPVLVFAASSDFHSLTSPHSGMLVAGKSHIDNNQKTGSTNQRKYSAEVKGRVDYVGFGIMIVIGQYIDITHNPAFTSKMKGITGLHNIPIDAMVDVSGYFDNRGNYTATRVNLEDHMVDSNDVMQAEGTIQELDLIGDSFMIGDQLVYFNPIAVKLTLENGENVKVHMTMDSAGDLHAVKIEKDNNYYNEDENVETGGRVNSSLHIDGTFLINRQKAKLAENVNFENGLTKADIVNGAPLKVAGYLDATGMLIVYEVDAIAVPLTHKFVIPATL